MNKKSLTLSLVIIASLIVTVSCVHAATEWSEDFEGDLDWEITKQTWGGLVLVSEEIVEMEVPGNTLKVPEDILGVQYIFTHPSDIKYGSMEFDLYIDVNVARRFEVIFMADDWEIYQSRNTYELYIPAQRGEIRLYRRENAGGYLLQRVEYEQSPTGWYHFEITRGIDNVFIINVNDSPLINVKDENPINEGLSTFRINMVSGIELDNIKVTPLQLESTSISVEVSESDFIEGDSVAVSGGIEPAVSGVEVLLTYSKPDSTTVTSQVTSSSDGTFTDALEPDMLGSWSLDVSWAGEGIYEGASSQSVSFTVNEETRGSSIPSFPLPSMAIGLLFAAIIMLTSFFATDGDGMQNKMRRRYTA